MKKRILFTGGTLTQKDIERINNLGFELVIERADLSEEELINALKDVDAYILGGAEKATARVLNDSKSLKVLAFYGVGYQSFVDVEAATKNGISVTNTPGANTRSVAEFTIALMLDAVKRLTYLIERTKQGDWQEYRTWDLYGRTLGILGMGTIGKQVAYIARNGFGMEIVYHSRSPKPQIEKELAAEYIPFVDLFKRSDILSIHTTYGPETIGLVGLEQLQLMKPTAVLVNAARAELVDAVALRMALENNVIAVAAMDGYYVEPVPPAEKDKFGLVKLSDEKILISPHTAYLTEDSINTMLNMSLISVMNLLNGKEDDYVVNPDYKLNARL